MTIRCHMPTCSFTQNFWGKTFLERTTVSEAPLLLRLRDRRAFTEKWFSVTSIGPWEIMLTVLIQDSTVCECFVL